MLDEGFNVGVGARHVAPKHAELGLARVVGDVEEEGDVGALDEGEVGGGEGGGEDAEGVFTDEAAKGGDVEFSVGGTEVHGRNIKKDEGKIDDVEMVGGRLISILELN